MVFFNCHICVFCGEKKERIGNDLDKILYVISAVGHDRPGLVHSVTQILSDLHINIIDIEARSVRGHFTMFLVVTNA